MVLSDTYSETDIIKQILAGDKSLYEIIVRRYNPYLYKLGRSFNFNHEDTQDLMQDTYIDAYRNLTNFRGDSCATGYKYTFTLVRNISIYITDQ